MKLKYLANYIDLCVILVSIILLVFFASRIFTGSFLWYDEAGQYYIAKGLFHYSDPFAPYGGLKEVLFYNRYFNKDPGGFGVILHFWSMVSNHYVWLRLLPFFFYLWTLILSYKICRYYKFSFVLSVLLTSLFLIHPVFAIEACELRAYSMEMCGTLLTLYLLQMYKNNWTVKSLLLLSFVLSVFMTSRYSFVLFTFSISLYVLFLILKKDRIKGTLLKITPFGIVLMISVILIAYYSVQYQFSSEGQMYVAKGYLGRNILALFSLPCLRLYLLLGILLYTRKKKNNTEDLLLISVLVSIIFVLFSALDVYPLDERRSMSLTVVQYFVICMYGIKWLQSLNKDNIAKWLLITVSLSLVVVFPKLNKGRTEADEKYKSFKKLLTELKNNETIYIHRYISPGIRYSLEEGELKGKYESQYTKQMYFAKDNPHSPCEYLTYEIKKPEQYEATFYLLQELKPLFVIDDKVFEPYRGYENSIYVKKNRNSNNNDRNSKTIY